MDDKLLQEEKLNEALQVAEESGEFTFRSSSGTLNQLPPELKEIQNLRVIDTPMAGIRGLPKWLPELHRLAALNLSGNKLGRKSWDVLVECRNLEKLGLSQCSLNNIPRSVSNLSSLRTVSLAGNNVSSVPSDLSFPSLRFLDLSANPIKSLPELGTPELESLLLWGTYLGEMPASLLFTLSGMNLRVLDVSGEGTKSLAESRRNESLFSGEHFGGRLVGRDRRRFSGMVEEIPSWLCRLLVNLEYLYVGGNQLSKFPEELASMVNLVDIAASWNKIVDLPDSLLELPRLEKLELEGNRISVAPRWFNSLGSLDYLNLQRNPIGVPEEILKDTASAQTILSYLSRIEEEGRPLNEAKIILVGEGSVGKTSIVGAIQDFDFDPRSTKTEGISTNRWMIPNTEVTAHVWDFGGQEIMHSTHQFFLSARSLYILVLDARQGEAQNRLDYWLKIIETYSEASPVIIVGNKIDQNALDLDYRGLRSKYPQIIGIVPTSCADGAGIDELKTEIRRGISMLSHLTDRLPLAYFNVKSELEQVEESYISFDRYRSICSAADVATANEQEALIGFLHDLGTVLCFRDDPRLADTNILSPGWVTGGVYKILNSNIAAQRGGLLSSHDFGQVLEGPEYPIERQGFIVDMMKRFELCYESDGTFFVPDLLTKAEPDTGSWEDALELTVKYLVLPPSILSRLVVRLSHLVSKQTVWRSGAVLAFEGNRAIVKADSDEAAISIRVGGSKTTRRTLLTLIRSELRRVEATVPGLDRQEYVPVPGDDTVVVPYSHLVSLEAAGHKSFIPQGLIVERMVSDLLDGIEDPADRFMDDAVGSTVKQDDAAHDSENLPGVAPSSVDNLASGGEAPPWSVRSAVFLGLLLVVVLAIAGGVFVVTSLLVPESPWLPVAAVIFSVLVGLFILRVSGRLSEENFSGAVNSAINKISPANGEGSEPSQESGGGESGAGQNPGNA